MFVPLCLMFDVTSCECRLDFQ